MSKRRAIEKRMTARAKTTEEAPPVSREFSGAVNLDESILLLPGPIRKKDDRFVPEDVNVQQIRRLFNFDPLVLEPREISIFLEQATGIPIIDIHCELGEDADRLGLTTTKKFYMFQDSIIQKSSQDSSSNDSEGPQSGVGNILNGSSYETFRSNPRDGRIKALANYIISREIARYPMLLEETGGLSAAATIQFLANWVNLNLEKADLRDFQDKMGRIQGGDRPIEEIAAVTGVGTIHSFRDGIDIVKHGTGNCFDVSNLLSDLLNSINIPARPIQIMFIQMQLSNASAPIKVGAHSIVEVHSPGSPPAYIDASPNLSSTGEVSHNIAIANKPEDLVIASLFSGSALNPPIYINITGAMPLDLVPPELRELLDQKPLTYLDDLSVFTPLFGRFMQVRKDEYQLFYLSKFHDLSND